MAKIIVRQEEPDAFAQKGDLKPNYRFLARKITGTLFASQSLVSAGMIAVATVSTILGTELSGNAAWAGLPGALFTLASAFGAFFWGMVWDRIGRRGGISTALFFGTLSAGLALLSVQIRSFSLFLAGLAGLGVARAAMQLGRFAAAEVHPPSERGRAISKVVIAGTVGAIVGPLLVGPSSQWALGWDMNELAGPFAATVILLGLAALVVYIGLRPEPYKLGKEISRQFPEQNQLAGTKRTLRQLMPIPAVFVAMLAMVLSTVVMVMLMGMTSLYMKNSQYNLGDISLVFSAHTLGMYAFSFVSGRLADQWGRRVVILSGAILLILATVLAPFANLVLSLAFALFLLGLGWNFCFVSGSAYLSDQLSPDERARTQGFNDFLVGLASAAGTFGSGLIFAASGYAAVSAVSGILALALFALTGWRLLGYRRVEN